MPTEPRLRYAGSSPLRPQLGCDLLVRNPGSRRDFVSAAIRGIDNVEAVLDVRDRRVIR